MRKIYTLISMICFSCFLVNAQIIPPYYNDFETDTIGWNAVSSTGSNWQWDTTNFGACNGIKVWGVGLDTSILAATDAQLYSPVFDFSNVTSAAICFAQKYNSELFQNGAHLEYTTNFVSWNILGSFGAPNPPYINWYNSFIISSTGVAGWSGYSPVCYLSQMLDLSLLPGISGASTVQFRFIFASDASINSDAFIIDDFGICTPGSCNCGNPVGIIEHPNADEAFEIFPNPAANQITITLKNNSSAKFILTDITGKEILRKNISDKRISVDIKNIPSGIYFIAVEQNGNIERKKIVISR